MRDPRLDDSENVRIAAPPRKRVLVALGRRFGVVGAVIEAKV